jgi:hypothetical protein
MTTKQLRPTEPTQDNFDYQLGQYHQLPDAVQTRPATVRSTDIVSSETFIIQTVRHAKGDLLFIEHVARNRTTRIVLPPHVTDVIARQRDAVAYLAKRKQGQRLAEAQQDAPKRPNPLLDPKVRAKALAARKAKAAKRRARREARSK